MSNITNLIGTTWRLDSESVRGIPEEYGKFNVNANGTYTYTGDSVPIISTSFDVGYLYTGTTEFPFTDAVSFYIVELNDGGTIQQNVGYMFVNTTQDTAYEFTITGGTDISNPLFIDFINTYGTLVSGGEPPTAEGVKSKLQSLITASNAKTGKSDANLTDAVNTLLEGFGSGDGIFAEEENEHGTTIVLGADLQEKTIDITANGTVEVTPDEGYALKKVTANVDVKGVDKIQRRIELNGNKADYLFYYFSGTSVDELIDGVDTSNVISAQSIFFRCSNLTHVPLFDTSEATDLNTMFSGCSKLTTVPQFDLRNNKKSGTMFYGCSVLTECWVRNIKVNLQVSNGTSYGHLLTLESLLHLCKECRKTTSSLKLTVGTTNLAKLEGIYVKLIPITDDMRAEDDLIDEKYPFVQCESTDEGAMTIQDYMATKMWSLA